MGGDSSATPAPMMLPPPPPPPPPAPPTFADPNVAAARARRRPSDRLDAFERRPNVAGAPITGERGGMTTTFKSLLGT